MHKPVLFQEVLESLQIKKGGRYIDGTLGLGGHAEGILQQLGPNGTLLGLDVDQDNLTAAESRLQPFGDQTITRRVNFRGLQEVLLELKWDGVDGMLFDLGISSVQLDNPERGFSFLHDGPLDMRLGTSGGPTALDVLESIDEKDLSDALFEFGEKRQAKRISRYLLHDIRLGKIKTTKDLAGFCERVLGRRGKSHPATRVFLALRALVNRELDVLKDILDIAPPLLNPGGRLAIITFHSLEDKMVKHRFLEWEKDESEKSQFKRITRKPIAPEADEIRDNPRARSSKLRVLERVK